MAFPTLLFNSSSGTDTQASGAGPATALFGTTDASTDGTGLIVTVTAGTDLSGVAIDGSAVIFLNDTTAGARNFGKITNTAGSGGATPTVTVSNAFGLSISTKSWAIGGKRLSLASTTSKKLVDNNALAGDAMEGWTLQFESGYTETIAAQVNLRRSCTATVGGIALQGEPGAGTIPILTFSNNGSAFVVQGAYWTLQDLEMRNTNATKTASVAFAGAGTGQVCSFVRIIVSHATNKFWKAMTPFSGWMIRDCEIGFCANTGIETASGYLKAIGNWVHDCTSHGIVNSGADTTPLFVNNLITDNGGDGIRLTNSAATGTVGGAAFILGNTLDGNTGDGIEYTGNAGANRGTEQMVILNNIISNHGGIGVNYSGTGWSDTLVAGLQDLVAYNNFFTNSGGNFVGSGSALTLDATNQTLDPQFTNAAGNDFTIGSNLAAKGFPTTTQFIGANKSATKSYVDIGVAQRIALAILGYLLVKN